MDEKTKATMLKYRKNSREQIQVDMAKGMKAKIKAYAERRGLSMSALIIQLLEEEMLHDGFSAEWNKRVKAEQDAQEQTERELIEAIRAENAASIK